MKEFGFEGELYCALLGDVVGSRQIERRNELQLALESQLDRLNDLVARDLAAPLVLISGDEIQGLFRRAGSWVRVVVELAESLAPIRLAWGVGVGGLTTDLRPETTRLDGPAFHRARDALEAAQRRGRWLRAAGFGASTDALLSSFFDLSQAVRSRWTARQLEFVRAARNRTQKDVAELFSVSPSVVSESLKAASFRVVLEAEGVIETVLDNFANQAEGPPRSPWATNSKETL